MWQLVTLTQGVLSASVLQVSEQLLAVRTPCCSPALEKLDLCKAARRNWSAVLCTSQSIAQGDLVLTFAGLLMAVSSEKLPAGQGPLPGRRRPRSTHRWCLWACRGTWGHQQGLLRMVLAQVEKLKSKRTATCLSKRGSCIIFEDRHKLTFSRDEKGREVRRKG